MNTTNSAPVPTFTPYRPAYHPKRTTPAYSYATSATYAKSLDR